MTLRLSVSSVWECADCEPPPSDLHESLCFSVVILKLKSIKWDRAVGGWCATRDTYKFCHSILGTSTSEKVTSGSFAAGFAAQMTTINRIFASATAARIAIHLSSDEKIIEFSTFRLTLNRNYFRSTLTIGHRQWRRRKSASSPPRKKCEVNIEPWKLDDSKFQHVFN